ncbi:MAG: LuxR C-terminal-related transcriptional regulator, partial [Acidobacteriota bacterium]
CLVQAMALRGERPSSYDLVVSPSNGKKMWLNVSIVLVRDELGGVGVAVHLFRDVTERRRLESYLQRALGERMAAFGDASSDGLDLLTSRERQVLELLASGFPAHVIAHRLSISQATVRNHTQNILNKLGVHSKLAAVALAYRHGLAP